MMFRSKAALSIAVALLAVMPLTASAKEPVGQEAVAVARPASWATPITVDGVPNLHRVAPNFYRSAQPQASGFQALAKEPGIKTVVSLRAFNSDRPLAKGTGLKLIRIKIHTWNIETEDVVAALANIRKAEAAGPVLLHCQHGADRTGLISALYRVLYQGWTKDAALTEMKNGSFGYHAIWGNIPRYLRRVDRVALLRMVDRASR
jgi:protein tyrosine phosphatase (PTP) superfamily phosphohydrolase (DUF442 family)